MENFGNSILFIITLAASIGLSLKYPVAGIPIILLLIYSFFSVYTSKS